MHIICIYIHSLWSSQRGHYFVANRNSVPAGQSWENPPAVGCASYFWTSDNRKYPTGLSSKPKNIGGQSMFIHNHPAGWDPCKTEAMCVCYSSSFKIILPGRNGHDNQRSYPLASSSPSSWDPWSNILGTLQRQYRTHVQRRGMPQFMAIQQGKSWWWWWKWIMGMFLSNTFELSKTFLSPTVGSPQLANEVGISLMIQTNTEKSAK